jgi:hypothetical protein
MRNSGALVLLDEALCGLGLLNRLQQPVHFIGVSSAVLVGFLLQLHLHPFCVRLTMLDRIQSQRMHGRNASGLS